MALGLLLSACGTALPWRSEATLEPNANLVAQGIPPIPMTLVNEAEKYTRFSGHSFVDWHPTRREMLISHRKLGTSTAQLFRLTAPMAEPEQLTDGPDPVRDASYEPIEGNYIVFARASGGDEADKLYRLDLETKQTTLLTNTPEKHAIEGWLHNISRMLMSSVPLDRTAKSGSRESVSQTLTMIDPLHPQKSRKLVELAGNGWHVGSVSWDDRRVALTRYVSAAESQVWILELATGRLTRLLPKPGDSTQATWMAGEFTRDGTGIYLMSDSAGEYRDLMLYTFADRQTIRITRDIPWDIDGATVNQAESIIATRANVDGRNELRYYDAKRLKQLDFPQLPPGSVTSAHFHPRLNDLQITLNGARAPNEIWTVKPSIAALEQWTEASVPADVNTSLFSEQQIVRWKSFDGQLLSGILNPPPARFTGKRPVLIAIHGGPESQAMQSFIGRANYFVNELGMALIQPNVRGSSGYGKAFLTLDNGMRREDAVKDIGSLLDWIATQPNLDASKVIVMGGSYGGYLTLASAAAYSGRIAGAVDVVGISNFLTFLKNTESYRRDLRRVEYGDERDPAMRDFLESISPLSRASSIKVPLFVVQGRNDPRVPYTEAEQLVERVRAAGQPVWYLRAENEGHGFVHQENADFEFYASVMFVQQTLKLPNPADKPQAKPGP